MLSIKSVVDQIAFGIQKVEDFISVARVACCEDDNLILSFQTFQELDCPRPDIDSSISRFSSWKSNSNPQIMLIF